MTADCDRELERALSRQRLSRYLDWAEGDRARAIQVYTRNTQLSESFYLPLQMLEIVLRNRIHHVMADSHGKDWLLRDGVLAVENQNRQITDAQAELRRERKSITPDRLVAALPFSFWTAMVSPKYETLWQQSLHRIGRTNGGKGLRRKDFAKPLKALRTLRNRIAHHEPIIHWNLPKHHDSAVMLTEWLSPAAARWSKTHSRFHTVYTDNTPMPGSSGNRSGR